MSVVLQGPNVTEPDISRASVRVIRSVHEVENLRNFWTECQGPRDSDIDVFLTVVQNDPAILRPHVLVYELDGNAIALMLGWIVRRRLGFRIGYRTVFNPLTTVMMFPYGSCRGTFSSETCKQLVTSIIDSLRAGEADVGLVQYIDANSDLYRSCRCVPGTLTRDHFVKRRYHRKRVLPSSVDRLYASLSSHSRKHFRQIQRKLASDFSGKVRIDRLQRAEDLDATMRVVETISGKTWQGKIGSGVSYFGSVQAPLFRLQAQKSWLRVYTLHVGNEPCAFWIGAVYQGTFYSDAIGFDPAYSQYSPGTYLLSQMMEEFCAEGVEAIDFGFSDEDYKRRFGNVTWPEATVRIFAPTFKGWLLNMMGVSTFLLHEPARTLAERTGLMSRVKKVFR